jgi:hypothetical protein
MSDWQSPDSAQSVSNWVAHPSWQTQGREEPLADLPRGLGLQNTSGGTNFTAVTSEGSHTNERVSHFPRV